MRAPIKKKKARHVKARLLRDTHFWNAALRYFAASIESICTDFLLESAVAFTVTWSP
jgi:hypothetical protein